MNVFYSQLAPWWPLLSPVDDYLEEAQEYSRIIKAAHPPAQTMLELGSGGGHNAFHLKGHFDLTLTDLSPEMLAVSSTLNPDCEHIAGDMRTLRLNKQFDAVFVHDAIDYMTTEADLAAAIATAYHHCQCGGVALFAADAVKERFEPTTECGGTDGTDGRGIRYLAWSYDPDPTDTMAITHYVFVVREADGSVRTLHEAHPFGLFSHDTWIRLLEAQGFAAEAVLEQTTQEHEPRMFFLGRRQA